jgi:hypothetical protein
MVLPISDLVKARVVRGNSYHQRRIKDALRFLTSATATLTEQCSAHREIQRSLKKLLRSYRHGIEYRFNNGVNIINGVSLQCVFAYFCFCKLILHSFFFTATP